MRRLIFCMFIAAALLPATPARAQQESYLMPDHILLQIGEQRSFNPPFGSSTAWASSDEAVAVVSAGGRVRATGPGQCIITATHGEYTASGVVFVRDYSPSQVRSLQLNHSALALDIGQSTQLNATTAPSYARNHTVYYISTDSGIATVDTSGRVTGRSKGEATVYAYSADWSSWDGCGILVGGQTEQHDDPSQQPKPGWVYSQGAWYYYREGNTLATGWLQLGDRWYYLREDGVMQTGWLQLDGQWYLFRPNGSMYTGWYFDWQYWYYLRESGAMAVGWQHIGGQWYYLHPSGQGRPAGSMATRWNAIDGYQYYFRYTGAMVTGWHYDGAEWYYLDEKGRLVYITGQPPG